MPPELLFALYIFVLAGFLGHHVISGASRQLTVRAGTTAFAG